MREHFWFQWKWYSRSLVSAYVAELILMKSKNEIKITPHLIAGCNTSRMRYELKLNLVRWNSQSFNWKHPVKRLAHMVFNQAHNFCAMCKQKVNKSTKMRNKIAVWLKEKFLLSFVGCFLKQNIETEHVEMAFLWFVFRHHIDSISDTILTLWPEN